MGNIASSEWSASSDVTSRLETAYAGLSPQLKRAARYVLDSPDDVALHSMRAIATRAGVQPSTMSRLVRQLDFQTYAEFREPFRERLRSRPPRYAARARHLQARAERKEAAGLLSEIIAADANNIRETYEGIGDAKIAAAAETLATARLVYVVGMRKCFPVAHYFHYACRMFHLPVRLVQGSAGTFADELRDVAAADALLAIGFDPYTRETVQATREALAAGAAVVAITDSAVSPLTVGAKHLFLVANHGPSFFRSLVAAMSLVQALVAFLVARSGRSAVRALAETERMLESHSAYWREGVDR